MSSPNKILIATGIFPPEIGGPASYGLAIAKTLAESCVVSVVTYSAKKHRKADKELPFLVARVSKKIPKILRHLVFFLTVLRLAKNSDSVFALNAVSAGVPAMLAARFFKKKFYVKIVGDYAWEMAINHRKTILLMDDFQKARKTGRIGLLHKLQVWTCKHAERVIVPSQYLADVVWGWGIGKNKIVVVYNGVDFKPINISREEARKKIGIHGNIILSVGRLVPWKGFRMLIKIMPQLTAINQFFCLVIVGSGPDQKTLEAMVKNLRLSRKVFLVGQKTREELALYLAAAEMFVLDTGYEGFSHQILEVISAGVPVITTAVGGNKEIVRQGENGFMVKYNDEFNLIEAIKTLWQMKDLREEFIKNGKKTIHDFSYEKMFKETVELL